MNSNDFALHVLVPPLQTTEVNSRKQFLEALENFELEKGSVRILNQGLDNNNGASYEIKEATSFYLVILRLSKECPFEDVRVSCENILTKLKVESFSIFFIFFYFFLELGFIFVNVQPLHPFSIMVLCQGKM